ncbi:Disease resistance protein [Actinidia chinensis var. chinensis]|uniref:Disease resistance protein n=1 Tax=Actinidia chinensis var. chinensis TaxID=1590841 RepID=A0A2R6QHE2_ACTCC|nr:Disease resistance protein [Actinidia chinensis var. chinensis]
MRGKKKKKKREASEWDPLYFHDDRDQERYNLDFSLRKVLNGRWIDYDFFDSYHFEYSSKMDDLRWTLMTLTRDDVYPDLVAYFYANATRGLHSDTIISYLKGNQWTPKPSKKMGDGSSSKRKEPLEDEVPKAESFKVEMRTFMSQMQVLMQTLHTKVDNMAFRLMFVEKKLRVLTKEVRKGKVPMEESESEEEEEEEKNQEEEAEKEMEETEKDEEQGQGMKGDNQDKEHGDKKDTSETESDASPTPICKSDCKYVLRHSRHSKFTNTVEMALELSSLPSPTTPIHGSSPKSTPPHITTPPPFPH